MKLPLRKRIILSLLAALLLASCNKEKEVATIRYQLVDQPVLKLNEKSEVFRLLSWQSTATVLMYIEPPSKWEFTDFAPWLEKNIKVELVQKGINTIHVLPYILYDDRHQATPLIFYSIRNDHPGYTPDWRTGPVIILGKQNTGIDFTKKADVHITRNF